jgi:hypothetical protein
MPAVYTLQLHLKGSISSHVPDGTFPICVWAGGALFVIFEGWVFSDESATDDVRMSRYLEISS